MVSDVERGRWCWAESAASLLLQIQSMAKLGSWTLDPATSVMDVVDWLCRILEVEGASCTQAQFLDLVDPESRQTCVDALALTLADGQERTAETRLLLPGGTRKVVEHRWRMEVAQMNGALRIVGTCQDITERHELGEQLRQQQADRKQTESANALLSAQLVSTFENLDSAFFTVDAAWRISYANAHMERCVGAERRGLLGQELWEALPALCGTAFEGMLRAAMAERSSKSVEGHFAPFSAWSQARAHGSAEMLAVYVRDISEEYSSRQQLELLQRCVTQISDILLVTEAAPIDEPGPRILYANDALYRLSGYTAAEVLGRSPRLFQGADTDRAELAPFAGHDHASPSSQNGSKHQVGILRLEMQIEPVRADWTGHNSLPLNANHGTQTSEERLRS